MKSWTSHIGAVATTLALGGAASCSTTGTTTAVGAGAVVVSPDAPSWAREGDQKNDDGTLFICEGTGSSEDGALRAASAICSAKICELCGVEVKATVETRETLTSVDVERKVVETCRRVRKSEDEVRYKQSACGPGGCTSWLQVFFSKESEARECKAYADDNFADPAQCERLIEEYRSTEGLTAASFARRVDLLNQAIVACADIDVRPTPRLTALDEITWQGVLTPKIKRLALIEDDETKPISDRVEAYMAARAEYTRCDYIEKMYSPIDRQQLKETKVFVDRLVIIRDAMRAYESIATLTEALAKVHWSTQKQPDTTALILAMEKVIPFDRFERKGLHFFVVDILSRDPRNWPRLKDYMMKTYPSATLDYNGAQDMASLFATDYHVSEEEWAYINQGDLPCVGCYEQLLGVHNHGDEAMLLKHVVEAATRTYANEKTRKHAPRLVSELTADHMLKVEPKLTPQIAQHLFNWDRLESALKKAPVKGSHPTADRVRDQMAARLKRQLQQDIAAERCDQLDRRLSFLEINGVDTRSFEEDLCRCVQVDATRRVGNLDELYLRLVYWRSSCVTQGKGDAS